MANLKSPSPEELAHSLRVKELEAGKFGKWFGMGENLRTWIVAIAALVIILPGLALLFIQYDHGMEFLKLATPIFTLALGYIAGEKINK